jgi:hypothetical protein
MALTTAGFIVSDDTAIWGTGATRDAAWADMLDNMSKVNIRVLTDGEEKAHEFESVTKAAGFQVKPATAALIAEVENNGGQFAWGEIGGIACTRDEEDAS